METLVLGWFKFHPSHDRKEDWIATDLTLFHMHRVPVIFPFFFFFNVCLFFRERETEHEQGRGREREGDTESKVGSML